MFLRAPSYGTISTTMINMITTKHTRNFGQFIRPVFCYTVSLQDRPTSNSRSSTKCFSHVCGAQLGLLEHRRTSRLHKLCGVHTYSVPRGSHALPGSRLSTLFAWIRPVLQKFWNRRGAPPTSREPSTSHGQLIKPAGSTARPVRIVIVFFSGRCAAELPWTCPWTWPGQTSSMRFPR